MLRVPGIDLAPFSALGATLILKTVLLENKNARHHTADSPTPRIAGRREAQVPPPPPKKNIDTKKISQRQKNL